MQRVRVYSHNRQHIAYVTLMLGTHYHIEWVNEHPDVVFLGTNSDDIYRYNCTRILMGSEHFFPKNIFSDIVVSHRRTHHIMQHSLMPFSFGLWDFLDGKNADFISKYPVQNRHFCMFMYGNKYAGFRNRFYKKMQKRFDHTLHSWGRWQKNITELTTDKGVITAQMASPLIMEHYRFVICFENADFYDNFTEKVGHALQAGAIPIYWGGDSIYRYIKKQAFINVKDFDSVEACLDHIAAVDNDPELYQSYKLENPFVDNDFIRDQHFTKVGLKLKHILDSKKIHRMWWDKGIVGCVLFKVLHFVYKKFMRLVFLKRYFFK